MCGRYTDTRRDKALLVRMGVSASEQLAFTPRYNIAPTQNAWTVARREDGAHELRQARWGLIPSRADDKKIGNSLINARSESIATKSLFRDAYRKRRCLVLADGFYEWQKTSGGKQPIYIRMREGRGFAFGGLWERWRDGERLVESFCIITVEPNELCATIHDRMPLILRGEDFAKWLDPSIGPAGLSALLKPYAAAEMECFPVSKLVNTPANESAACVERVETARPRPASPQLELF
ncbi:MAG TPA: SOS response-associated peptidase [Verrucomicrobiae bacterium]|nr:SOS response-associated peptidase [Verrucomicrobiae bacterium]